MVFLTKGWPTIAKTTVVCAFWLLAVSGAQAAVLLIDPSTTTGVGTIPTADVPYAVPSTSQWNRGSSGTYGVSGALLYSDGTAASGVSVLTDDLAGSGGTGSYNFGSPSTGTAGNPSISTPGVFATNPVNNAVFGGTVTGLNYGGIAMKVGGLPLGTYDIYVVAAYVGTATTANLPGNLTAAQQNLWAFKGTNLSTLSTGTFGTANELLENSTRGSWTLNNNYAKLTVTLDASNPYLYLVSEGALNDGRRGWMNSVQIVSVPEPSATLLLSLGTGAVVCLFRRRRRV